MIFFIEICQSPHIYTRVSIQITGSFRVCRTFFKHPMTNFVKSMYVLNQVIYGIGFAFYNILSTENTVTSTGKISIPTAKKHDIVL